MRIRPEIATVIAAAFVLLVFSSVAAAEPEPLHPCHPGGAGGPGVGPPCPPTPVPADNGTSSTSTGGAGPVSFRLINRTPDTITLWLGIPVSYVLNVPGNSEIIYTINRGVYDFELLSCGRRTTGWMDLTVHTFYEVPACQQDKLVRVVLTNQSDRLLAVHMSGPSGYVVPVAEGQSRTITIPRGDYSVRVIGCRADYETFFQARHGQFLVLSCP